MRYTRIDCPLLAKALTLSAAIGLFCAGAAAQTYTARDLGTLRHGSGRVHALNQAGQAVGGSGFMHGADTHAFFWEKQGGFHDLGTLAGGDYSAAFGINDAGQVVGTSNTARGMRAFAWSSQGGLRDLGVLSGANSSAAYAINNGGDIAGLSGSNAVLWINGGSPKDLGTLGGDWSEAHGISNQGHIVGVSATADGPRAFLWNNGAMQDLGVLAGDTASRADHVSDQGTVVGASEGPGGVRAFLWTSDKGMQSLGSLAGSTFSEAYAVNSQGQVVGESGSPLGTRAFLWTSGAGMVDLNDLTAGLPSDVILTGAFAINSAGQIVALGMKNPETNRHQVATLDSHTHAAAVRIFLLTPQSTGSAQSGK